MGEVCTFPRQAKNTMVSCVYDKVINRTMYGPVHRKVYLITKEDVGKRMGSGVALEDKDVGYFYMIDDGQFEYILAHCPEY